MGIPNGLPIFFLSFLAIPNYYSYICYMELKVGDKVRIDKLETVIEYFKGIDEDEMVGTPYGEFNIGLVEKIEDITPENGLQYAKGYADHDLNQFVGLVPARELEDCEEIDSICQIHEESTGIVYVGFVVKKWDTASVFTTEWIGSKLAQSAHEKFIAVLDEEIASYSINGGDYMKSMNESVTDSMIVKVLKSIKEKFE